MHSMVASIARRFADAGSTRAKPSRRVAVGTNDPFAFAHLSKNGAMSTTRSRTIGRWLSGAISSAPPAVTASTCVRHVQRALPFTVIAHDPHMPTRQAYRYASDG